MDVMTVDRHLPRVLVVEDDAAVRSFLRTALEPTVEVTEAEDGQRAIEILHSRREGEAFDLVITDQVLPKRSGLEVLRMTKRHWPRLRVVLITAFGSEDLAVQALRAGAVDYLKKPIQLRTLMNTVATLTADVTVPSPSPPGEQRPAIAPGIERAMAFMREHFAEGIALTDVAAEVGLARLELVRLFQEQVGMPFHEYLQQLRVALAREMLADRKRTVAEVAAAVGFTNPTHFNRAFLKIVGRTPAEYRISAS